MEAENGVRHQSENIMVQLLLPAAEAADKGQGDEATEAGRAPKEPDGTEASHEKT